MTVWIISCIRLKKRFEVSLSHEEIMLSETKSNLKKAQKQRFSLVICTAYGGMSEK